jgi:hypothetical protein
MSIGTVVRTAFLAIGLIALGAGAASACDNCERHDGYRGDVYRDGGPHDGWRDHDGYRDGDRHDGWHDRDGYRDHDGDRDDCRDHCYRHDDCRDGCGRRHYDGCHDGCGWRVENYSCVSGRFDCRFEGSGSDERFRERYYDAHGRWVGGGAYGYYGH